MHTDKVPLAYEIKIAPHHIGCPSYLEIGIPRDWHGVFSIRLSLNANQTSWLTEIKCQSCQSLAMGKGRLLCDVYFNSKGQGNFIKIQDA